MQVCISVNEEVIKNLDKMVSLGLFPPFVRNRSTAITYLISQATNDLLDVYLDKYDSNF